MNPETPPPPNATNSSRDPPPKDLSAQFEPIFADVRSQVQISFAILFIGMGAGYLLRGTAAGSICTAFGLLALFYSAVLRYRRLRCPGCGHSKYRTLGRFCERCGAKLLR